MGHVSRSKDITAQVGTEWSTRLFHQTEVSVSHQITFRLERSAKVIDVHEIISNVIKIS